MNNKAQFTPGPWHVSAGRVITTSSGQFYLTYGKDKYGNPLFKDFVELDNNATLIAAAPAMYEALKGCLRVTQAWKSQAEMYGDTVEIEAAVMEIKRIKAALAQAEGK